MVPWCVLFVLLERFVLPCCHSQGGCFEFDILLPADYPNRPPQVQFLTTGSGRIRFNPNLYNTGKVCLSLLGTWSGPGWDSKASTLLQVNTATIGDFLMVLLEYVYRAYTFVYCRKV